MNNLKEVLDSVSPQTDIPPRIAKTITAKALHDSIQNIGGFPVTDHLLVQDRMNIAKAQRAMAIAAFESDKTNLLERLSKMGIADYLAIVPTNYWKNICDRHGLVTIKPNMDGMVSVNTKVPFQIAADVQKYWSTAGNIFGVCAVACAIVTFVLWLFEVPFALLGVAGTLTATFTCFMLNCALNTIGKWLGTRSVRNYITVTPYAKLVTDLVTPTDEYRWSNSRAQLIMPAPPIEVVLLLRKLRDARELFTITAEPGALTFNPSVEKLYHRGYEIEMERIAAEKRDPIITLTYNNATVVLAQFGDFKWERAVVEDVVSSTPLSIITKDS